MVSIGNIEKTSSKTNVMGGRVGRGGGGGGGEGGGGDRKHGACVLLSAPTKTAIIQG